MTIKEEMIVSHRQLYPAHYDRVSTTVLAALFISCMFIAFLYWALSLPVSYQNF